MRLVILLSGPRYLHNRMMTGLGGVSPCVAVRQRVYPVFLFSKILRMEKRVLTVLDYFLSMNKPFLYHALYYYIVYAIQYLNDFHFVYLLC